MISRRRGNGGGASGACSGAEEDASDESTTFVVGRRAEFTRADVTDRDAAEALGRRPRAAMASSRVERVIWPRAFDAFWITAGSAALPQRSRHLLCTRSAGKTPVPSTSAS